MRFTALVDFYEPELKSQYVRGLSYTVRPEDVKLAQLVPQWVSDGKIAIGGGPAKIVGTGEVI